MTEEERAALCEKIAKEFDETVARHMPTSRQLFLGNVKLGEHIYNLKKLLPYGQFEKFVQERLGFSVEQARLLRQLHIHREEAERFFEQKEKEGARVRCFGPKAILEAIGVMKRPAARAAVVVSGSDNVVVSDVDLLSPEVGVDSADGESDEDRDDEGLTEGGAERDEEAEDGASARSASRFLDLDGADRLDRAERKALERRRTKLISEAESIIGEWATNRKRVPRNAFRKVSMSVGMTSLEMLQQTSIPEARQIAFSKALIRMHSRRRK